MKRALRPLCLLSILLLVPSARLSSQANYGNIIGTITDPAGGVVPNAKITIVSEERGVVSSTATNESGNFTQTHLVTGSYRVEIEAPGFQRHVQSGVQVGVDRSTRLDVQLQVGAVTEEVTVSGIAPALVTDRAEVSVGLQTEQVNELPTLNRNLTSLQLLLPGSQKMHWQHATSENPQGGIQINNNGQDFGSTNFTIDGMDNNDPVLGIIVVNPSIDSVGEYKYTTGNFDAEFAQAGGAVIQVVTKSGTNELHGSLFEFLQNDIFNARNPFSEPTGPPPLRWNQFGGSLGGPIKKDNLFVFGDYQGTRRRTGASLLTTVPSNRVRNGDFSNFSVPIFDPATGDPSGAGRTPFANNQIPADRISAPARNLLSLLPQPNFGAPDLEQNNYTASGSEAFDSDQFNIKVDHYATDKWKYFVRYSFADFEKLSPPAFGPRAGGPALGGLGFAGTSQVRNQNLVGSANYVVAPTLLTDFRAGFSRYNVNVLPLDFGTNAGEELGIPNVNLPNRPDTSGIPSFVVEGNGAFRQGFSLAVNNCNCPLQQREHVFQFVNNWTKISGNHTLKWGGDFRHARNIRIPSDRRRNGQFVFNQAVTGNPAVPGSGLGPATFLLGLPSGFERFAQTATDAQDAQNRMFYFAQDTWRITQGLTLSLGLRWDTWFPNYSVNRGQGSQYDVTTNTVVVAGVGDNTRSSNFETQWTNFSPRIAIAYQVTRKTVIRTGIGRSYFQEIFGNTFNNTANGYPTLINQQLAQTNLYTPLFELSQGPPPIVFPDVPENGLLQLPNGIGQSYRPRDLAYSYVDSWNFSVERLIGQDVTATVSYVGNIGHNLRQGIPLNQAIPGPGPLNPRRPLFNRFGLTQGITDASTKGSNNYNSLQTKLNKRFSRNFSLLATYTWSKTIDNSQGLLLSNRLNRAVAEFDRAHVATIGHTLALPFGPGQPLLNTVSGFGRHIVEGWQLSGVSLFQSGRPFSPTLSNNASLNADAGLRPDQVPGSDPSEVPGGQNRDRWFEPSVFSIPAPFQFGNAGRNSIRGPGQVQLDWALHKAFRFTETKRLTFRWEVFNFINRANLNIPNTNIDAGAGALARITALETGANMRNMQLGLRFDF
ncbi:MAG: TonB-dependent receptor [Bryobacteraceae bacterium]|nr:TonB-dependent receptor [Bryobacteraceae bacterium]